jgi:hypothetical protein
MFSLGDHFTYVLRPELHMYTLPPPVSHANFILDTIKMFLQQKLHIFLRICYHISFRARKANGPTIVLLYKQACPPCYDCWKRKSYDFEVASNNVTFMSRSLKISQLK